jgi:hypothetical protein
MCSESTRSAAYKPFLDLGAASRLDYLKPEPIPSAGLVTWRPQDDTRVSASGRAAATRPRAVRGRTC